MIDRARVERISKASMIASLVLTIIFVGLAFAHPSGFVVERLKDDYWQERAKLLNDEESLMLGGILKLNEQERLANQVLMREKLKEIDNGFHDPNKFLPSQSFLQAANEIRKSRVFQIIMGMPKGAILHAHDTAIVSFDYVFGNITYRPNLYVCDVKGELKLKFFEQPNKNNCDWQLLSEVRKNDKEKSVDQRIEKQMTMMTKHPDQVYVSVDAAWKKFGSIFRFITPMLTYLPVYEDHFYQGLSEFYNDNVLYLELRTTLPTLYDLNGTEYGPLEIARLYKRVTERFIKDHPDFIGMKLIYAPFRGVDVTKLDEYIATARLLKQEMPDFIAGFDLVGQEDKGKPLVDFADKLRAIDDDVELFFHAGETNWYGTSTDENLIDAVMLNTKRIGHGYALLKHPKVMELVRQKNIAIEINPISNQVLKLVKDLRNHPASVLFAGDYPVVISNDDPGLWGAQGLSYDFYEAFIGMMSRNADLRSLKKLAINSIVYSSLSETEKNRALETWSRRWDEFVRHLSSKL